MIGHDCSSTRFPYTTLFRSWRPRSRKPTREADQARQRRSTSDMTDPTEHSNDAERVLIFDTTLRDGEQGGVEDQDRKSTRLNSSHMSISYAVFCLKKKKFGY